MVSFAARSMASAAKVFKLLPVALAVVDRIFPQWALRVPP